MLNHILANFYERDLRKLIEEVNLFQNEDQLWQTRGSVKNSSGNLVLHLIGSLNHFFGTILAHSTYVRNRDQEFARKAVPRQELVAQLEEVIPLVTSTLRNISDAQMESEYPIEFDGAKNSHTYVLVRLLNHLSYHLGQVNYLRRIQE
jgi:hypothetical protein